MFNSTEQLFINKDLYKCVPKSYPLKYHEEYNNLKILDIVPTLEREVGLINDLSESLHNPTFMYIGIKHSSFVSINCSSHFKNVYVDIGKKFDKDEFNCLQDNIKQHKNILLKNFNMSPNNCILKICDGEDMSIENLYMVSQLKPIILSREIQVLKNLYSFIYKLTNSNQHLYIPDWYISNFYHDFNYYLKMDETTGVENILQYDNLVNLCVMVKNGGDVFEKVLTENLPWIDRWTILDTGSTDNTIEIINKVLVGKKKGKLYQEPFINFRESRNRCLDLCGTTCKYNVMLDDTYIIQGEFRDFLEQVRGDQFADSFSLLVKSDDTEYYSNRVTKSKNKLRYIYTIHEVVQKDNNVNVVIPAHKSWIYDVRLPYMEERTMSRKQYDLDCLFDMVKEYPDDPRHLYYIAQTYNLLGNHEMCAEYFRKRAFHPNEGFDQEKIDALFEMTRTYNFKLNKPWEECEKYYKMVHEWDPERPEASYFLGIHYFLENQRDVAFDYFKRAFNIGFPLHRQYSLKPTLSFHFLPRYLAQLCYEFKDFKLGEQCTKLFLDKNKQTDEEYNLIKDWHNIFRFLNTMAPISSNPIVTEKPIFCFVADGGFNKWSGKNILTTGVGGSETYIIELSRYIQRLSNFEVVVFCNCEQNEIFEGVKYIHLNEFFTYASTHVINTCIISRYSEYVPVAVEGHVKNVYIVLHDLGLTGNIIPMSPKLKGIFCLSEWHRDHYLEIFPHFRDITHAFHYGIDFTNFLITEDNVKIPHSFIYSSFPNRGLLTILQMWPRILRRFPDATINIFVDLNNKWANDFYPEELKQIRQLLETYKNERSIVLHGWVDKKTLATYWKQTDVWFYPCNFRETFCLTALEAAITKTLAITNDLAALQNTVGDRGVVISGDATTHEWQEKAFQKICEYLDSSNVKTRMHKNHLINKNYEWARTHSWEDRARELLTKHIYLNDEEMKIRDLMNSIVNGGGDSETVKQSLKVPEDFFLRSIADTNFDKVSIEAMSVVNRHWYSLQEMLDLNYNRCKNMNKIIEVGPGQIPFKCATHIVDNKDGVLDAVSRSSELTLISMDVDSSKYNYNDNYFDYAYCRHVFEDIQNPEHAFEELKRVSKNGYIETPSPLIEISRNVDSENHIGHNSYRGYIHHRYIVYTDYETNTICFIPKLPIIEYLNFDKEFEYRMCTLANKYPLYWNNYYTWNKNINKKEPRCIIYKPDNIRADLYINLLMKAVISSFENTNKFIKEHFSPSSDSTLNKGHVARVNSEAVINKGTEPLLKNQRMSSNHINFNISNSPVVLNNVGHLYVYSSGDYISNKIIKEGEWESYANEIFDKYVNKNSVVVDVGAFIGSHTLKLSRRASKVYAFEPFRNNFDLLTKNMEINRADNVIFFNKGLGDKVEHFDKMFFPESVINNGCARLEEDTEHEEQRITNVEVNADVNIVTLDSVIHEKIDFIKIDVEGYERKVVEGAMNLITKYKPVLMIEDWYDDDYSILTNMGYKKHRIINKEGHESIFVYDEKKKEELDYAGMYNWTNDLPKGSKIIFDMVLSSFVGKKCNILEVGTYAGMSIIAMLGYLPMAIATTIDSWKNYEESDPLSESVIEMLQKIEDLQVEKVFYENVKKASMTHRVTALKGDSADVLLDLIKTNAKKFDFIYIDGSHKCLDCYTDCLLAWKLLEKDGVMAIDDYLYHAKNPNVLESPYHAVNYFLGKIKGQYNLINKGYRVFIQKI